MDPGRPRRRRRLSAAFVMALIARALLAALVASQPANAQSAHSASVVPDGLFTDLVKLDRQLARLIHDERTKGLDVFELRRRVDEIAGAKLAMVDQFFAQPVYGVRFNEVFRKLDCLDVDLQHVVSLEAFASQRHVFSSPHENIVPLLEHGKQCKQKLEDDLHKANTQPPAAGCTGHAMLGNIYGGQAHELVTDFTCPKPSSEFSLTVPSSYQISGGQASNAASSGGYSCNLNSTNTTVNCTGSAPAGSTTYVQMTTSPNPRAGMMLLLNVSSSDSSTASFTLTSQ